jgi:hypothetical protein
MRGQFVKCANILRRPWRLGSARERRFRPRGGGGIPHQLLLPVRHARRVDSGRCAGGERDPRRRRPPHAPHHGGVHLPPAARDRLARVGAARRHQGHAASTRRRSRTRLSRSRRSLGRSGRRPTGWGSSTSRHGLFQDSHRPR